MVKAVTGQVIIVTGGASGLGQAIVTLLRSKGAIAVVIDQNKALLSGLDDAYYADITNPDAIREVINAIVSQYNRIDGLVNNVGMIESAPLINLFQPDSMQHSFTLFKNVIDVNVNATFLMTAAVLEYMVKNRASGAVVNISSIAAKGNAGQTAYSAAKAAVQAMTKVWSKELGPMGIRFNSISPGFIDTPSTHRALTSNQIEEVRHRTPLRRLGNPIDVAHTALYLIENEFINGADLDISGGLVL